VLVTPDGQLTLLDWEFAHLGDPAEDLGWYTAPLYLREHFIEPTWTPDSFLDRYRTLRGETDGTVDAERLHFWQVLAMFKLAAIALTGIAGFVRGEIDRAASPIDDFAASIVRVALDAPLTEGVR
jgi:aminoglycoside phosphotransferase (APT) family kinase protein